MGWHMAMSWRMVHVHLERVCTLLVVGVFHRRELGQVA